MNFDKVIDDFKYGLHSIGLNECEISRGPALQFIRAYPQSKCNFDDTDEISIVISGTFRISTVYRLKVTDIDKSLLLELLNKINFAERGEITLACNDEYNTIEISKRIPSELWEVYPLGLGNIVIDTNNMADKVSKALKLIKFGTSVEDAFKIINGN